MLAVIGRREVSFNRDEQIVGTAVVQKESPLTHAPQRGRPEHVSGGKTSRNIVRKSAAHVGVSKSVKGCAVRFCDARVSFFGGVTIAGVFPEPSLCSISS